MSKPKNLKDLYAEELKDLWSANDQMVRAVKKFAPKVTDARLKDLVTKSQDGISGHTDLLKSLLASNGETASKEHCKGMEGLAAEAVKHAVDDGPDRGAVLDAVIIAQYQRMTHYGIAGFGTAAAFAEALDLKDDTKQLRAAVKDMYGSDEFLTKLAETAVNIAAE